MLYTLNNETLELAKEKGFILNNEEPTQALLEQWLRDTHNINISQRHSPSSQKWGYALTGAYSPSNNGILKEYDFKKYDSFREFMESALLESLKFII